jgi:hypothetical protein
MKGARFTCGSKARYRHPGFQPASATEPTRLDLRLSWFFRLPRLIHVREARAMFWVSGPLGGPLHRRCRGGSRGRSPSMDCPRRRCQRGGSRGLSPSKFKGLGRARQRFAGTWGSPLRSLKGSPCYFFDLRIRAGHRLEKNRRFAPQGKPVLLFGLRAFNSVALGIRQKNAIIMRKYGRCRMPGFATCSRPVYTRTKRGESNA